MPNLRIVTWNSRGEDAFKANALQQFYTNVNNADTAYPHTDVILIQEALQATGGAIWTTLNQAGWNTRHITEQVGGGGRGYICATNPTTVTVATQLTLWDYGNGNDANFDQWLTNLQPFQRVAALDATVGRTARPPALMGLTLNASGANVALITWHAPRGVSAMFPGTTMQGGALIDAFLAMDNSRLMAGAMAQAGLAIIAGDLNCKDTALRTRHLFPLNYEPFPGFDGRSSGLDHILAKRPGGRQVNVADEQRVASSSDHDLFAVKFSWQ